jgi:hypothetical protein
MLRNQPGSAVLEGGREPGYASCSYSPQKLHDNPWSAKNHYFSPLLSRPEKKQRQQREKQSHDTFTSLSY